MKIEKSIDGLSINAKSTKLKDNTFLLEGVLKGSVEVECVKCLKTFKKEINENIKFKIVPPPYKGFDEEYDVIEMEKFDVKELLKSEASEKLLDFDKVKQEALDRVENGDMPACAKACPTGALTFGNRSQLLAMAYERLNVLRKQGNKRASIYGEKELGGLGFFYILLENPEFYGLPKNPKIVSKYFYNILSNSFIGLISAAVISLGAIFTFRDRRKKLPKNEQENIE